MFARRTQWDLRPNALAAALAHRTRPWTDLTVSNPTAVGLDYPTAEIAAAWASPAALRYRPDPRGWLPAREAIANYYRERGVAVAPEHLILTASTSEGYAHLLRLLCDPGDRIHVPCPSYPLLDHLAALADVEIARYPLWYEQAWHCDLAALEQQLGERSRAILVIHPNNPTGSYCRMEEWQALAQMAARRRLALIVDEVFFDYVWDFAGTAPPTQAYFAPEGTAPLVFVLNGFSKLCGLPQAKLAWIAVAGGDGAMRRSALEKLEIIADTFLSVGGAVQIGAAALLAAGATVRSQISARVAANLAVLDRALASLPPESATLVTRYAAEGGWNAVLRWPNVRGDEAWARMLLDRADVLLHPGHFYDFASESALVLSLLPDSSDFAAGVSRALALAGEL